MWSEVLELGDDADLTHRRVFFFVFFFWRGLAEDAFRVCAPALDQQCPHSEQLLVPLNTPLREDHGLTMTEIPAGLQTMSSLSLTLSPEQLWPPCSHTYTHRPLTHNGTSPCGKHAIQISGLYRTPVRPSDRVSGALWFQIAPNDEKHVLCSGTADKLKILKCADVRHLFYYRKLLASL